MAQNQSAMPVQGFVLVFQRDQSISMYQRFIMNHCDSCNPMGHKAQDKARENWRKTFHLKRLRNVSDKE